MTRPLLIPHIVSLALDDPDQRGLEQALGHHHARWVVRRVSSDPWAPTDPRVDVVVAGRPDVLRDVPRRFPRAIRAFRAGARHASARARASIATLAHVILADETLCAWGCTLDALLSHRPLFDDEVREGAVRVLRPPLTLEGAERLGRALEGPDDELVGEVASEPAALARVAQHDCLWGLGRPRFSTVERCCARLGGRRVRAIVEQLSEEGDRVAGSRMEPGHVARASVAARHLADPNERELARVAAVLSGLSTGMGGPWVTAHWLSMLGLPAGIVLAVAHHLDERPPIHHPLGQVVHRAWALARSDDPARAICAEASRS